MASIPALPPIEGVRDFATLLDFLKNQAFYEERLGRLLAHQALIEQAAERLIGAEEVDVLRNRAATDRNMAAEELRAARTEITRLTADAFKARDAALEEAKRSREELAEARAAHERARKAAEAALHARDRELTKMAEAVAQREADAQAARKAAEALREEFTRKLDTLKARVAEVS